MKIVVIQQQSSKLLIKEYIKIAKEEYKKDIQDIVGNKAGKEIDKYNKEFILGIPWCMSFIYYCLISAANKINISLNFYKSSSCIEVWYKTLFNNTVIKDDIKVGDIVIFGKKDLLRGHAAIIISISPFLTIEGNLITKTGYSGIVIKNK